MKLAELAEHIGEARHSEWILVDQARITSFAECTEDRQFIHLDPVRAAAVTGTGGTIAHGFLTLSLLGGMSLQLFSDIEFAMGMNYGFDKVRFLSPVPEGKRVRGMLKVIEATERKPGAWLVRFDAAIEIEDMPKPALVAEWLMHFTA